MLLFVLHDGVLGTVLANRRLCNLLTEEEAVTPA